jgi:hypothetical protein
MEWLFEKADAAKRGLPPPPPFDEWREKRVIPEPPGTIVERCVPGLLGIRAYEPSSPLAPAAGPGVVLQAVDPLLDAPPCDFLSSPPRGPAE